MADSSISGNLERFKGEHLTAFVVGYTGATGKYLVDQLDKVKAFKRVVLIGRREVPLSVGEEFEQKVVDFDKLDEYSDVFYGCDVGFYLLGTTRGKAGKEGFIKVDRDYCLKVAQIARSQNCKHYILLSSMGAKPSSNFLYLRIKGEVEEAIKEMDFDRLSIFRPSYLMGKREECRASCCFEVLFLKPIACCCYTSLSIHMDDVAMAMIVDAFTPGTEESKSVTFENRDICRMATDLN